MIISTYIDTLCLSKPLKISFHQKYFPISYTVEHHYCTVQFPTISRYGTAMTAAEHKSHFELTTDTHISPSRVSYGVSLVMILEKIDRITTAPCCTCTCIGFIGLYFVSSCPHWLQCSWWQTTWYTNRDVVNSLSNRIIVVFVHSVLRTSFI